MKVLGIIAEYNPFHNGHLYHLQKSIDMTEADFVVAIISGNFTQRGEAAIVSKWTRAEMAIKCGIDLVIELPFVFACNNAEYFAKGAIEILNRLKCITHLSFGSESGNMSMLKRTADFLSFETDDFKYNLKKNLDSGFSYPKARSEAVKTMLGEDYANLMVNPNNILAIEYLKQLYLTKSDITPVTVKRYAADYNDFTLSGNIASASAIRNAICSGDFNPNIINDFIPAEAFKVLINNISTTNKSAFNWDELYYNIVVSKILTTNSSNLKEIFSVAEGLENKLKETIRSSNTLSELKDSVKSKRYTATRISRLLTHICIGLTKSDFYDILNNQEYYAHILGFNQKGAKLLKMIKKSGEATIPCITNLNKESDNLKTCQKLLTYDMLASDFYNLLFGRNLYMHSDQLRKPYIEV